MPDSEAVTRTREGEEPSRRCRDERRPGGAELRKRIGDLGRPVEILAQKVQADLAAAGIQVSLDGLPRATALQKYREAKDHSGCRSWAADYPSAIDFLVYVPGSVVGNALVGPRTQAPRRRNL